MPGLAKRINDFSDDDDNEGDFSNQNSSVRKHQVSNPLTVSNEFWSRHRDDLSYNQLQKFWCELSLQKRQELLRIDKTTLFEQARKNMYCSRCNGLLLEGFFQIVMYAKSLQQNNGGHYMVRALNPQNDGGIYLDNGCQYDALDPAIHPWGGLTIVREGTQTLTLLDSYLHSKSLKALQHVFDSARAREREREMLYPDACGGGNRGWVSQGMVGYGRGHGTRETCALHTARLSVETLVDFWSALGEETRQSLVRMKEEDFIERLMYRFDSKRFCRDCRRNVIREFKELKELKRMRKDTRCTSWFCGADTAFQYEVSRDTVQADWQQTFSDTFGTYHHFEWAIGTEEGKSDILEFENVGLSGRVQVNGLDLSGLKACFITLRAFKKDGRCNELCVKAHALRGKQCVHCKLVVGDGFVTITRAESIRRFFEHAEEAEEEEDDDSMDKDGNDLDGECSRPQKHAKSPELAREFLLDAAMVIFKEQVEKAFREGTARQNAHSIFVCLALKLLEERVHVACKEIIIFEKQTKLLEEEEKEKREEEERKERKERQRTKEREKKLRRKERLREKENRENKCAESNIDSGVADVSKEESAASDDEGAIVVSRRDSVSETGEATPDIEDDQYSNEYNYSNTEDHSEDTPDGEFDNTGYSYDHLNYSHRRSNFHKDPQNLSLKWSNRRTGTAMSENGIFHSKYERYNADGFESTRNINGYNKHLRSNATKMNNRNGCPKVGEKFQCIHNKTGDYHSHGCTCNHHNDYRSRQESHITKPSYRGNRYIEVESAREINGQPKSKITIGNPTSAKKVWEPLDSQKKYVRSNSDSDVTLRSTCKNEASESVQLPISPSPTTYVEVIDTSVPTKHENNDVIDSTKSTSENCRDIDKGFHAIQKSPNYSKASSVSTSSNSDNCSSCLSEGDSNPSNPATSDSEESSQNSEIRETSDCLENKLIIRGGEDTKVDERVYHPSSLPTEVAPLCENGRVNAGIASQPQNVLPQMHNQSIHYPVFQAPSLSYYHQTPVSWPAAHANGLMSYPHSNHYLFPNTYGYGLNGNARFMQQYGTLQHVATPILNSAHLPVYQPLSQEQAKIANLHKAKEVADAPIAVDLGTNVKPDKTGTCNNGFSLFHFGGPVALSSGKEGSMGDSSPNFLPNCSNVDHPCNKDSVNEYNLFAASNGIKFSIF